MQRSTALVALIVLVCSLAVASASFTGNVSSLSSCLPAT